MERIEFYRELYYKELEEKRSIDSELNLSLTILTLIGGWLNYSLITFDYKISGNANVVFLTQCLLTGVFLLISVVLFIHTFSGIFEKAGLTPPRTYLELQLPNQLENYYNELMVYNNGDKGTAMEDYKAYLIDIHNLCTARNKVSNRSRRMSIDRCKNNLGMGMVLGISILFSFAYNYTHKAKPEPQEIKIMNPNN